MTIKSELLALAENDGKLHAERVVRWAKAHRASQLHRQFEWNDTKAAHEYRIWQARRLIQINITTDEGLPEMVNLTVDRVGGGGYRRIDDVLKSRELSAVMLSDALDELDRVRLRYERVKELVSVWTEIDKVRRRREKAKAA